MFEVKLINHNKINIINLNKIIEFKKTFWKYTSTSQKNFLKKNSLPNDIHLLIFTSKKELVGYSFLNFRDIFIKSIDDYDEIILIGSGKGVTSVSEINDLKWKRRKTGCYTKLNKIYNSLV